MCSPLPPKLPTFPPICPLPAPAPREQPKGAQNIAHLLGSGGSDGVQLSDASQQILSEQPPVAQHEDARCGNNWRCLQKIWKG